MFSKGVLYRVVKGRDCVLKSLCSEGNQDMMLNSTCNPLSDIRL